jgi:hypothetical protein
MGFDEKTGPTREIWKVQLAGGAVLPMTLDELDNAFQEESINVGTMVLKPGAFQWATLGAIAGIGAEPSSTAAVTSDIESSAFALPVKKEPIPELTFGTKDLAALRPKRRVRRMFLAAAVLSLVGGVLFAFKSYGAAGLREKLASVASVVKGSTAEEARAAAVAPQASASPPPAKAKPAAAPSTVPHANAPAPNPPRPATAPTPVAAAAPAAKQTDHGGNSHAAGSHAGKPKKTFGHAKSRRKQQKSGMAIDPIRSGTDPFDPLNGAL